MLTNDDMRPTRVRRRSRQATDEAQPLLGFFPERCADACRIALGFFAEAVAKGTPMPVTARGARQAPRLADAAPKSARTGRAIRV